MKKTLLSALVLILLTGCFDLNKEKIACGDQQVKKLTEEIVIKKAKEDYFDVYVTNNIKPTKKQPSDASEDQAAKAFALVFFSALMTDDHRKKIVEQIDIEFKDYKLTFDDLRTTKKEKELNRVECHATTKILLDNNYSVSYDVDYTGQLTDNLDKVIANVTKLDKK